MLGLESQVRLWAGLSSLVRRTIAAFKAGRSRKQAGGKKANAEPKPK